MTANARSRGFTSYSLPHAEKWRFTVSVFELIDRDNWNIRGLLLVSSLMLLDLQLESPILSVL